MSTAKILEFAAQVRSYLGVRYVYGGESRHGVDCSGLMQISAAAVGIGIPRTSDRQFAVLQRVAAPVPGDLVFFNIAGDTDPQPAHVGMVTGPDQMINAPYTGTVVRYDSISRTGPVMGYCRVSPLDSMGTPVPPPPPLPPVLEVTEMIAPTPTGKGYWVCKPDGSIWSYGDARYCGGLNPGAPLAAGAPGIPAGSLPPGHKAVGIAGFPVVTLDGEQGYWILSDHGSVYGFGIAAYYGGPNF